MLSDNSFESRTGANSGANGSFNTTDAITNGPAHAPRPASSTPAMGAIPAAVRSCSITFKGYFVTSTLGTYVKFLNGQITETTRPETLSSGTNPPLTSS